MDEDSLTVQNLALAAALPDKPLVLGGCCCSHVGAVEGLATRFDRLAVVWFDAHGDLNTPETSTTGNEWGMPLRMLLDSGAVGTADLALVGARNLDPPEEEYIAATGLGLGPEAIDGALRDTAGVYVALDLDAFDESEVAVFMPVPDGLAVSDVEELLVSVRERKPVLGAGLTAMLPREENLEPISRLTAALGF